MKISKKLLIGSITTLGAIGVGATVVAPLANTATVAAPLADSFTHQNLSEVEVLNNVTNNSEETNSVVNEVTSVEEKTEEVKNVATAPEGTVTSNLQVPAGNQYDLNWFLNEYFETKVKSSLSGDFKNVDIFYKVNSANFENKTFQIKVTPSSGYQWNDSTNSEKEITVSLTNIIPLAEMKIESARVINYNVPRAHFTSTEHLNNYLKGTFSSKNLQYVTFNNVEKVEYVDGSAKMSEWGWTLFTIKITPKSGTAWYNGSTQPRTISVSFDSAVPVASVSSTDNFSYELSTSDVSNDSTFNTKLESLFKDQNNVKKYLSGNYSNVNLTYVKNSANFATKQFQVTATPSGNYLWSDYTKTVKTITIKATNFLQLNTPLPVKVENSFSSYVKLTPAPTMVATAKTINYTTYQANFTISPYAYEYGWYNVWSYSTDGGKTWTSNNNGMSKTFNVSNTKAPKGSLLKFQIMVRSYYNTPAEEGYAMTFTAI
ncbi:hypothetical protein [Malacoplasma penetrans]|nr:hypothetical protein [Malacoplasma penetrans]